MNDLNDHFKKQKQIKTKQSIKKEISVKVQTTITYKTEKVIEEKQEYQKTIF